MNRLLISLFSLLIMAAMAAWAQDTPRQPTAEEIQMMEKWQKYSTPGEHHAVLSEMAGDWTYSAKFWMKDGGEPMTSEGTSRVQLIFGGRYVVATDRGEMMGMPFEGKGTLGYDSFREEYVMTWIDNMSTAMFSARGKRDAASNAITMNGRMDDIMTGERDKQFRWVFRLVDADHHVLENWDYVGTPKEYKSMEITYTRNP